MYYFDKKTANKVINWIETYIRHVKGELTGQPLILEDWQKKIIGNIFGWKDKRTGLRKYRKVYIEIPKKNSKSTISAALALYLLLADGELGAEIFSAAADRFQAGIIFDIARLMVESNPSLYTRCDTFKNTIVAKKTKNFYKAISADAYTKHGINPHGIIFDELHTQKTRELYDTLTKGVAARRQPLTIMLTTAGYDKETICWKQHELARKINEGIIKDETFYGVIYNAGENEDIYSEKTWKKANPGYGIILKREYFEEAINDVKNEPSSENAFRRLHLNQWVTAYESWISDSDWMKCTGKEINLEGKECFGGLDLASTRDFNSLVLVFPIEDKFYVKHFCWLPSDMVDKRVERYSIDFFNWVRDRYIKKTEGNAIDLNRIIEDIKQLKEKYVINSIAYDSKFAATLVTELVEFIEMSPFAQDIVTMNYPTKLLERLTLEQKIIHFGNPVLRWMISNVAIYTDANENIKVVKNKSIDKIDGVVALIMALGESVQEEKPKSVYEERGIIDLDDLDNIEMI